MRRTTATLVLFAAVTACGDSSSSVDAAGPSGTVAIDGSSTVFPITEAVAEEFRGVAPRVRVTVGISGTGGGFKKFVQGETDVSDASRPIKPSELDGLAKAGREFIELPVAYDGLAVVVHGQNDFCKDMTIAELKRMWSADSTTSRWSDIRDGWPDREFKLFAPGSDSGTFDYFTEVVNGQSGNCRADATFSEDDNVLVRGVAGDRDGIGFFGFAYYAENRDRLRIVAIDGGSGPVTPSRETIENGSYAPLSRPLFIYVGLESASKPQVDAFVQFYLENMSELAAEVGYVALPKSLVGYVVARYSSRVTGTVARNPGSLAERYQ